jgi:SAM-dependent methyltransferase
VEPFLVAEQRRTLGSVASDRYGVEDDHVEIERRRLHELAALLDRRTFMVFDRIGVQPGWTCLEVGAGAGTVSRGLAERVGDDAQVWSVDIDLRFHDEMPANVDVRELDITRDALPPAHFDLVHARAVLQHLPEREAVLDRLLAATKPGGWIVLEDGDSRSFAAQELPEPYATVHRTMASGEATPWRDANFGSRMVALLRARGVTDLQVTGGVRLMRPHEPSGEWWFLAVERVLPRFVASGVITDAQAEECKQQMRAPGFVMLSPLSLTAWGRAGQPA